eukprot:1141997-Pelagomonas_calceolata.AAC.5
MEGVMWQPELAGGAPLAPQGGCSQGCREVQATEDDESREIWEEGTRMKPWHSGRQKKGGVCREYKLLQTPPMSGKQQEEGD